MPDKEVSRIPPPSTEDQRIATGQFEYANRAIAGGNHDIAIGCLRTCCRLVPTNLSYRQMLRKAQKAKYDNNLRGSFLAPLTTWGTRSKLRKALKAGKHQRVLEMGELVLSRNPWEKQTQILMSEAAAALELPALAVWILQQAREKNAKDPEVNRALARLLEKQGHFSQAMTLWELVRKAAPTDVEAQDKMKHLAVSDTIARGNYENAVASGAGTGSGIEMPAAPGASKGATPMPPTLKKAPTRDRTAEEEAALKSRLEGDPTNVDGYLRLGTFYRKHGKPDQARAVLERGLESAGQSIELALVIADLDLEPLRTALMQAEAQVKAKPGDDKVRRTRDKLVKKLNEQELDWFRLKAEHDPGDRNVRYEFGMRLLQAGRAEEAIPEFQAARGDPRLQWKALMQLGYCFKSKQNWPLARRNFEEALKQVPGGEDPHRKDLLFELAQGNAATGEYALAVEKAMDLADMDYGYRNIGRLLQEWQEKADRKPGASAKQG